MLIVEIPENGPVIVEIPEPLKSIKNLSVYRIYYQFKLKLNKTKNGSTYWN